MTSCKLWLGSVHKISKSDYDLMEGILEKLGKDSYKHVFYRHMDDLSK